MFPRLLAVAQIVWGGTDGAWEKYESAIEAEMHWLTDHGINGRPIDAHTYRIDDPVERSYEEVEIDRHQAPERIEQDS